MSCCVADVLLVVLLVCFVVMSCWCFVCCRGVVLLCRCVVVLLAFRRGVDLSLCCCVVLKCCCLLCVCVSVCVFCVVVMLVCGVVGLLC